MEALANFADGFINLFRAGGNTFMGLVTGIIPMLVVLITAVNAIIKIVGEERVEGFAKLMGKNMFTRYTILPFLAVFFLTNPMCYTFGKFLPEKYKPAYYDAAVSLVHPILGLFPHANAGELFVYMGIATGVQAMGYPLGELAVRYFLCGMVVILIRGVLTERITIAMMNNNKA